MTRQSENKIILIRRKTRLDDLVSRFNTVEQARFYIEHLGADFSDYLNEHEQYGIAVQQAEATLGSLGRLQILDRAFLPNFIFGPKDTVVAIGQDGLIANVLKYLDSQPLIGVNPDPKRWDGILLPFVVKDLGRIVPEVFNNHRSIQQVTMAKATLNTGENLYGVNDLFIGPRTHTSARYMITSEGITEAQSSSGIIVSTGLGSTGWYRSIVSGAAGIVGCLTSDNVEINQDERHPWNADYLHFAVREPWPSKNTKNSLTFGKITQQNPLTLISQIPDQGVIFSDGIESDFIQFNSGTKAVITIGEKVGHLVV